MFVLPRQEVPGAVGPARFPALGSAMLWATYTRIFRFRPLKLEKHTPWSSFSAPFVAL
jgi:hypothetical protein